MEQANRNRGLTNMCSDVGNIGKPNKFSMTGDGSNPTARNGELGGWCMKLGLPHH